jgi:hypothetical protein
MTRVALWLAVFVLAACGQQETRTYPPQYELNFMRACQAPGQASSVCSCTWERITREIPVEEFESFEQLPANEQSAHPLRAELQRYALECIAQNEAPPEDPPPP